MSVRIVYAWIGQTESDRLEDANIVQLRSTGSRRGSAGGPAPAEPPDPDPYAERPYGVLGASLTLVLVVLAVLYTWLRYHA